MGLPREWPEVFDAFVEQVAETEEARETAEAQEHRANLAEMARQHFGR